MRQIYIPFVVLAFFGCAGNKSAFEVQLDRAEAKQRELSAEITKLSQDAERLTKQTTVCDKVAEYTSDVREAATKAYNTAKPVVVQGVTDAYTWAKKEVQEHTK